MKTPATFSKMPYPTALRITERYQPSDEAQLLLTDQLTPAMFIAALEQQKHYQDIVTFIAHGLPSRECIAWALQCCREIEPDTNDKERAALAAARAWYRKPSENNRRFAEKAANEAELQTSPGWVAQAVFWSSGSVTPPDTPVVPPPLWLYCHAVAGAINLAAVLPDGQQAEKRYPLFIHAGLEIAKGMMPQSP